MGIDEVVGGGRLDVKAAIAQSGDHVPSVVLGAARRGEVLGVGAAGTADVALGIAASGRVPYRIGSITKTFTAAAVLGLVEDGTLALDDLLSTHLSGTPFGEVPLRALLAHRGGVQREAPGDMWESMRGSDAFALRRSLGRAELVDRPGVRWHYSNLGYALLGLVVEAVTGESCPALIDRRLIAPLGLTATGWKRPDGAASGYRVDPYADVVHREPDMDQGAVGVGGQLWSTAADLLVWGDALAGGASEVVSPAVVEAMHTLEVMVDRTGWTSGWGLGLILERRGDRVLAGHTGAMPGFLAALSFDRTTRSVAVALSNATRGAAVGALAAELVDDVVDGRTGVEPVTGVATWVPLDEVPSAVDGVLGRWWSEAAETVFTWRADGLHALLVGRPVATETRFEQLDRDLFRAVAGRFTGERLTVRRDVAGEVAALEWATYPFTRTPR
ncbi:serine hydrolase domain-containing protein [Pseudonocardia sp.]|uniref:serine hydrolase domain-containing protein n=1 Tax=Pseudonocardia sp. TaxID=60912 RepID=UPI0026387967|nr:serine hydrolase domain-containing protein [Pseudonocardia sp.]